MVYLLDINVLLALVDTEHQCHSAAVAWFLSPEVDAWATCPLVENGVLRILGQSAYPNFDGGPEEAREVLDALVSLPGHQFWRDDVSLRDRARYPVLRGSKHLTDIYLIGLAAHHRGKLATFDQRIDPGVVAGGPDFLLMIPSLADGRPE